MFMLLGNTSFFSTFSTAAVTLCCVSMVVTSSTPTNPVMPFTRITSDVEKATSLPNE